jgi:putative membrane protein insertion efficiency factor
VTPRVSPLAGVLVAPIRFYQRFITPYTPATCRYYPTCSSYAVTALRQHGAIRGSWLTLRRLGRCHPWSEGGIDYVPSPRERRTISGSSVSVSDHGADSQHPAFVPVLRPPADAPPTDRSSAA